MKYLKLVLILVCAFSCAPEDTPLCDYEATGATNYVSNILTDTDSLSNLPGFNFPYTSPFLDDLQEDLTNYTGYPATVSVDASRNITIILKSEILFSEVIYSNNLDGSQPFVVEFERSCE